MSYFILFSGIVSNVLLYFMLPCLEGQILINRIWYGPHTSSCNFIHENSVTFYVAYMILITLGGVVLCFWLIDNIDNVVSTGKRIEKCTDFYNLP